MDIAYVSRSAFLPVCEDAIRGSRGRLDAGDVVEISLSDGGYSGRVVVDIRDSDTAMFGTDWTSNDPTRFPARIRAAATALFHCGCRGQFTIAHGEGLLTIQLT